MAKVKLGAALAACAVLQAVLQVTGHPRGLCAGPSGPASFGTRLRLLLDGLMIATALLGDADAALYRAAKAGKGVVAGLALAPAA
jgi:hypothetical protein